MYHPDEVDISDTHQRDLDTRPWWHRAALEKEPLGKTERSRVLRREYSRITPQTDAQLAEMTANYFGMISFIDHGVGRVLDALEQAGLEDDTIQKDKLDRTKRPERERIENISPCAECYSKGHVRFGRGTNDLLTINHGSFWRTRSHT